MTALVIYIAIAGSSVPWVHKIAWFASAQECAARLPAEVALTKQTFTVAQAGCITFAPQQAQAQPAQQPRGGR